MIVAEFDTLFLEIAVQVMQRLSWIKVSLPFKKQALSESMHIRL